MRLDLLESVDRYEIVDELGAGAMSKVYLAHDPNLDRKLALKVLLRGWSLETDQSVELEKRFLLEARAAGKLSHPNIVRVFDADTDARSGIPYIAMEWIQGGSLAALLNRGDRLAGPDTLTLLADVARALDYAHQFGRIHRDIKPSNILIATDGAAKVSDFGVAKIVSETHTISGQVLGTPAYMSPEQVRDEPLDGRSDLFSLGAVLYQCVGGRTPFGGDSLVQIVYKILNVDPRPLGLPRTDAWMLLKEVVDRALHKEPARRYQSGAQFAEFLEAARHALESEGEEFFPHPETDGVAGSACTTHFDVPVGGMKRPRAVVAGEVTDTIPLRDTEIRDAVESDRTIPGRLTETVVTGETAAVVQRLRRRRWIASSLATLLVAAAGSLVAARWLDRSASQVVARPVVQSLISPTTAFSADGVEDTALRFPKLAPRLETPDRPPPADPPAAVDPVDVSAIAGADHTAIPPPSALSRTGGDPAVSVDDYAPPGRDVLTPVTIMYRHKGGPATLQVLLDGVRIWNQRLEAAEGHKQKLLGYDSHAVVTVPSGKHELEVRLADPARGIDASDTLVSRYTNGRKRSLRINLDPGDNEIRLRWKE